MNHQKDEYKIVIDEILNNTTLENITKKAIAYDLLFLDCEIDEKKFNQYNLKAKKQLYLFIKNKEK